MARKGENIYKRKDGRYEGRYVKYYEANGKPHWGYVYDRSYSVVKSKLSEKKANNRLFSTAVPTNLLLYEWIEMWIDAQRQIKLSTKTMYYSHLKNHIQGSIGNVMLKKLNSAMIQRFIDDGLIPEDWDEHNLREISKLLPKAMFEDCRKEEPETVMGIEDFGKICSKLSMNYAKEAIYEEKQLNKN